MAIRMYRAEDLFTGYDPISRTYAVFEMGRGMVRSGFSTLDAADEFMCSLAS